MPANRGTVAAGVLVLAATLLRGAPQVEADPHDLYEKARHHVTAGELNEAAATISRLRSLIEDRPDWDPEGVFAKHLLPPLQARLDRLLKATRMLDDWSARSLKELQPPDSGKDISTVRDYTEWTTSVIQRLRKERDEMIAAALGDPGERAILARTESYQRTESLLQVDALQRMAESAGDDVLGLVGGDAEIESVLVRFRQLKRDLMEVVSERDQLKKDAGAYRERTEAALDALLQVVTDGEPARKGRKAGRAAAGVADRFRRFLDDRRQALAKRTSLRSEERAVLLADISRYKRYNAVLREAGLGQDESAGIGTLSKMVSELPVQGGGLATVPARERVLVLVTCGLSLATVLLGWLAVARRRRLEQWRRSGVRHAPMGAGEVRDADTGPKAA